MDSNQIKKAAYQAQISLERSYPAEIEYKSQTYLAACIGMQQQGSIGFKGYVISCALAFRVRKDLMPDQPEEGKLLQWQGNKYRIIKVPIRDTDPAWYIACAEPNADR